MNVSCTIVVDADACPVKQEIILAAKRFDVPVLMVASFDHRIELPQNERIQVVQVDRSSQSADLYIANHMKNGDILVTQDYGLAALGLAKSVYALSNRGKPYKDGSIDFLLERRHEQGKLRRGGKHTKGPKPFSDEDRRHFLQSLTKLLLSLQENVVR